MTSTSDATSNEPLKHRFLIRVSLATIFVSGLNLATGGGVLQLSYLVMLGTYFLMAVSNRTASLPKGLIGVFFGLLVASMASVWMTLDFYGPGFSDRMLPIVAKVALACFFLAYYLSIYVLCGSSVNNLFREYLRVAAFFAALGILQQAIYVAGHVDIFGFLATGAKENGWYLGIAGLSVEPAFYACALLPAAAYYSAELVWNIAVSPGAVLTITAVIFSTSSLGYLGIALAIVISTLLNFRASRAWILVVTAPLLVIGMEWMFRQDFFQLRLQDTIAMLGGGHITSMNGRNISSYALVVNASMTIRAFQENFGVGAGFGMYSVVFDRFLYLYEVPDYRALPGRGSATSLLLRITAELGVIGLAIVGWTGRCLVRAVRQGPNAPIAVAYLATFLVVLLRMGEYYSNGVLLVIVMAFLLMREANADHEAGTNQLPRQ
ncbi:O-antigen ligase family protein [Nocardioides cavernaquae]|uniref:O-antigen ligase domain-containing protein n=1 Tax=Nocardioides cavernaquae TaxID=2321396 RepID=A0A3A5H3Q9_9ACTN|nr:O-antigen ligase family protein [Nocardioides cavernaquae]RJS45399.1 hypothetical protein D4739_03635 [Nocardioides cavernaquae]